MLVPVPFTKKIPLKDKNNAYIWMSLLNAQSVQDKDCAIVDYFWSNNKNIAIITEPWLQNTNKDACRLSTSEFSTGLFSAIPSNRQDRMRVESCWYIENPIKLILLMRYLHIPFKLPS